MRPKPASPYGSFVYRVKLYAGDGTVIEERVIDKPPIVMSQGSILLRKIGTEEELSKLPLGEDVDCLWSGTYTWEQIDVRDPKERIKFEGLLLGWEVKGNG